MWHSKRKEQEVLEKDILKEVFLNKLNYIKRKKYNDKVFEKLSWIFKVFIMNYFHIKYEYTNQELKTQLQRKRIKQDIKERIIALSDRVTDIKYNKETLNKKEFLELVKEMKNIIKEMKKKEKEFEKKTPLIVQQDKLRIITLIKEGKKIVRRDLEKASDIYEQIYHLYSNLPADEKKDLQPKITKLYNKINKAMLK